MACRNVYKFRIQTAAAIVIQCFVRSFFARQGLKRKRFEKANKAALAVQCVARRRAATRELQHRVAANKVRIASKVAVLVQAQCRRIRAVAHVHQLREKERIRRQLLEIHSATMIQRVYRGFCTFRWVRQLAIARRKRLEVEKLERERRQQAVVLLQRRNRGLLARTRVHKMRLVVAAKRAIAQLMSVWAARLRYLRALRAIRLIQRCARGFVHRLRVQAVRLQLAADRLTAQQLERESLRLKAEEDELHRLRELQRLEQDRYHTTSAKYPQLDYTSTTIAIACLD